VSQPDRFQPFKNYFNLPTPSVCFKTLAGPNSDRGRKHKKYTAASSVSGCTVVPLRLYSRSFRRALSAASLLSLPHRLSRNQGIFEGIKPSNLKLRFVSVLKWRSKGKGFLSFTNGRFVKFIRPVLPPFYYVVDSGSVGESTIPQK
jgi:hypothetical protein